MAVLLAVDDVSELVAYVAALVALVAAAVAEFRGRERRYGGSPADAHAAG